MEDRIREPGGLSQYCFIAMLAKPFTPPKKFIRLSRSSAVCGTFAPPEITRETKESTASPSILSSLFRRPISFLHFLQVSWKVFCVPGTLGKYFGVRS